MKSIKHTVKAKLNTYGTVYNALAWIWGVLTRNPAIRRNAKLRFTKDSRFEGEDLWMAASLPSEEFDLVVNWVAAESILDVGCGIGTTIQYGIQNGLEMLGLEGSRAAIKASPVSQFVKYANLNKPVFLCRKFDLVWCVEVAEHIHPKFTDTFLDTLVRHGDNILLSAASPGQGGFGHFNEQPQSYWVDLLHTRGFTLEGEKTRLIQGMSHPFASNMMLFSRIQ